MVHLFRAALVAALFSTASTLLVTSRTSAADASLGTQYVALAQRADLIAFGTCEAAESSWDDQHRFIITALRFRPRRSFKGHSPSIVTVKTLGGQIGMEGMIASHSAAMSSGEDAVLFLQHSRFGDYYVLAGGADGKLPVRTDARSGRTMIGGAISLDDFDQVVRELTRAR